MKFISPELLQIHKSELFRLVKNYLAQNNKLPEQGFKIELVLNPDMALSLDPQAREYDRHQRDRLMAPHTRQDGQGEEI